MRVGELSLFFAKHTEKTAEAENERELILYFWVVKLNEADANQRDHLYKNEILSADIQSMQNYFPTRQSSC